MLGCGSGQLAGVKWSPLMMACEQFSSLHILDEGNIQHLFTLIQREASVHLNMSSIKGMVTG